MSPWGAPRATSTPRQSSRVRRSSCFAGRQRGQWTSWRPSESRPATSVSCRCGKTVSRTWSTRARSWFATSGPGSATVIGRSRQQNHVIGTVRGSRHVVTWIEFMGTPDETKGGAPWSIYSHDLKSGKTATLATGQPSGRFFTIPRPELEWPFLVWADLPDANVEGAGPNVVSLDMRSGDRRILASGVFPGDPSITRGQVYFDAIDASSRELFVVPADGSASPRNLDTVPADSAVTQIRAKNGWVSFIVFPQTSAGAIGDLPVMLLSAANGRVLKAGQGTEAAPSEGYAVFNATGRLAASNGRKEVNIEPDALDYRARWSVDRSRVAYVTVDDPLGRRHPAYLRISALSFP